MRNKPSFVVATNKFLSSRNVSKDPIEPYIQKCKKTNLLFTLILSLSLLVSVKGFAQLSESFDSGIPDTWTLFGNGVETLEWSQTTDGYLGTNGVSVNPSADNIGDGNTAQYFLVTPLVTVPENGEIQFYTKQASEIDNGTEYEIRISTAAQPDINGFNIVIQSYTETDLNIGSQTTYEKKVVELPESIPAGLNIYIAFVAINTQNGATPTGDEWFVDEVEILEGCIDILNEDVTIDQITVDSAQVSWSHPIATNFEIQILPVDGVPATTGIPVVGTNYNLINLEAETEYDVYISSMCDNDTQSNWAGPFSFTTLRLGMACDAPIVITASAGSPYLFTDNLMYYPNAADTVYATHGTNCLPAGETQNYLLGDKIFFTYTPDEDGVINISQMTHPWTSGTECWGNAGSGVFIYENCSMVGVECLAGLKTTTTSQPETIENFSVTAGTEYTIVMSTNLSAGASICFDFSLSFTTCPTPSVFSYENLLQESVTFSWNNPVSIADAWEYAVVLATDPVPTGADDSTATNVDVDIMGLTAGTAYHLYVRPMCGGTPGEWSVPYPFTTQCDVLPIPYSTDFAGSSSENPEACWTILNVNNDGVTWTYDQWSEYATIRLNDYSANNLNNNHDMLVTPTIHLDGSIQRRLRFKYNSYTGTSVYALRISTTGVGVDNFTTTLLPETQLPDSGWDTWLEVIVNIPISITGDINIAWVIEPNAEESANSLSIDDVFIEDKPACPDPFTPALVEGSETETTAQFTWTQGDEETQWEILILPINDPEPDETSTGIITSDNNPYTAEGLDPATHYKFYVRAYCNLDEQSNWIGPVEFITSCVVFDTPFYESFDDTDPDTQKFCWTINNVNQDSAQWVMEANNPEIRGSTSWFDPTTSYDDWLISPPINAVGNKELKYNYRARYDIFSSVMRYGLEVLISYTDADPSSFEVLVPLEEFTNIDYVERSAYFQADGVIYIAFRVPPDFVLDPGTSILDIDDISIDEAPACPDPNSLVVDNILDTSASFSWVEGFLENQWEVVVQEAGMGQPTNAQETVDELSYAVDNLNPGTDYEFYVRARCDASTESEWVGPLTFTTLCVAFPTPFVETFNSDSESESCWRIINGNNDSYTFGMGITLDTYEGDEAAGMFTGTNGANDDWLISPIITVTENQRLRYFYRVNDSTFEEDLEILLSTNGIGLDQFTTVLYNSDDDPVIINNVMYLEKIIEIPSGITGDINIAWHIPEKDPNPWGYRGQILVIDNVIIEDIPECPEPYNFEVVNVYDTSVEINWETAGSETQWEVVVQPSGTDAPGNSPVAEYTYIASSHPFTIDSLDPAFSYDVYVRAICGTEYNWVGPIEFTTFCSFENLCQYTVTLTGPYSGVGGGIDVIQNENIVQTLQFPTGAWTEEIVTADYIIYLCEGVEFSFYWDSVGTAPGQYPTAFIELTNSSDEVVWTSEMGIGTPRTVLYTGVSVCSSITCPQPTDLNADEVNMLSWTAGGLEDSWEVYIQPYENGTLPQSGIVVDTPSYIPQESDFVNPNINTYEYFVRGICGEGDESFWSGPFPFIINDDKSNAITLIVSDNEECSNSITASLINSTSSSDALSCDGVNGGDIWYEFVATSSTHLITLNDFSGDYAYDSGGESHAPITLVLYADEGGVLTDVTCSSNNAIATLYSTELTVGTTYKLRVILNQDIPSTYTFNVCVRTITDPCAFGGINGSFEDPIGGPNFNFLNQNVTYGWRYENIYGAWEAGVSMYIGSINTIGVTPIDGSQFMQMLSSDAGYVPDLNTAVDGLYQDFDTSEATVLNYSFLHASRAGSNDMILYAGPPEGPFVEVHSSTVSTFSWQLREGTYEVPEGQTVTRFAFRTESYSVGNLLDAVSIVSDNSIITESQTIDCTGVPMTIEANGIGTWLPGDANPGVVIIDDVNNNTTTVSGFTVSGDYTFTWQTRYCQESIVFTYNGITDVPTVATPVEYCLNDTATALTATATTGYSLMWYTEATGGTGSSTAPTPDTSSAGSTSYFVANIDTNGCEGPRVEIVVTINDVITPELTFSYNTTCIITSENPLPTLSTDFTTGGTFTSSTVTVDSATGEIDITSATAGSHNILYTYDGDAETCTLAGTYTTTIEFTAAIIPVTMFDYGTEPFCLLSTTSVLPNLASGFTTGGLFSSATVSVNATTGEVDLTSATAGMHDIVYNIDADPANCMQAGTYTTTIEIIETVVPVTTFTYAEDFYCTSTGNIFPELATGFTTGGVFSSQTGLTIDATTGEINFSTSTTGSYTITYTITEDLTNCVEASFSTFIMNVSETTSPVTMFDYGTSPFCILTGDSVLPNLANGFTTGGIFSANTLTVNPTTGEIDLTSASAGIHTVVYTFDEDLTNCILGGTYTTSIEILELSNSITGFSYDNDLYCAGNPNIQPNVEPGFTSGGTFSAETGLSINPSTGEINISASDFGNYTVTYEITEDLTNCIEGSISTFNLTILDAIEVVIDGACNDSEYWLTASPGSSSYNPDEVTYTWMDSNGNIVGDNSEIFNVTEYADQNPNVTVPAQFSVTVDFGGCSATTSFTTERFACRDIPRGISPDGNGKNDTFDLSGYGVVQLSIFNRNGREVYSFNGNYNNQWYGQSNNDKELPDGTYFYAIKKDDGSKLTGWVFINRAH